METLSTSSFKSVTRPKNLSSQIVEQLSDAINKGVFGTGSYLPSESKLVEIFGVSRGVIREALLMLSAKGVIEIQKGKGALLLKPSIDSIFDSFSSLVNYRCGNEGLKYTQEIRMIIEPQIASLSAEQRTDEDIKKIEKSIENMKNVGSDTTLLSLHDIEFHKNIWFSCGNPMFSIILEPIFHFLTPYHKNIFIDKSFSQIDTTFEEHVNILRAIVERDGKAASNFMKHHLRNVV